jgi:hypothetical protein
MQLGERSKVWDRIGVTDLLHFEIDILPIGRLIVIVDASVLRMRKD